MESGGRVIEGAVRPADRIVAGLAGAREPRRDVIYRSCRSVVVILVTAHTRGAGDVVVVVHMAIGALPRRYSMRPGQREAGAVVIEDRVQPRAGAVALIASLREVRGNVIRIRRALIVLEVARHASGAVQRVIVVDVAVSALPRWNRVQAGQRKSGGGVIELAIRPLHSVVALLAGGWKARVRNRARGSVVVILVTTDAGGASDAVIVVDVTVRALPWRHGMRTRQWKS